MERIPEAYDACSAKARGDIAAGRLRRHYGARGAWGEDLAKTLLSRFGGELVVLTCFVTDESLSFVSGYNAEVEAYIDSMWGQGSVAAVHEQVQRRRKETYDAGVAAEKPA